MYLSVTLAVCLLWLADNTAAQECVCLERFGHEVLTNPTFFKTAPGDNDRIFISEQTGFVWIYDREGTRLAEPFMDISDRFSLEAYDENGLLGMTFHPDFQTNNKFYIYYSITVEDPQRTRVAEFLIDQTNPDQADMDTERVIMEIDQPMTNHNGGEMFFGVDDGFLYIFTGDGGGSANSDSSQDMASRRGKALRIDVDTGDDDIPFTIPEDNPFVDLDGALPEIFSLGFRNPWRCTMDAGDGEGAGRGRIYCGDVGQDYCEEVDIVVAGGNYGWDERECGFCYPLSSPVDPDLCIDEPDVTPGVEVLPVFWYTEWAGEQSIIGGHVYRGSQLTDWYGDYFWCDLLIKDHTGLSSLREESGGSWTNTKIPLCDADTCGAGLESEHADYAFAFGQDQDNEMYILESTTLFTNEDGGIVYKVVLP